MKTNLYIFVLLCILSSCTKDEAIIISPNIGNYELASLTSNIPLDLNYDNNVSTDFKNELEIYFLGVRKPRHHLELIEFPNNSSTWAFFLGLPRDYYYPELIYVDLRYGVGDYSKLLHFKNNKISIEHIYSNEFPRDSTWLVDNNYPYPHNIVFTADNEVTIKVIQKFYDLSNEKWVVTNLVGIFEKKVITE